MKSHCLGPQILSDYAFLHYNYKYDWLRPTLEEIVDAYTMRIKREETRRSITVLFVTLNKKTHTVSALDCTVH